MSKPSIVAAILLLGSVPPALAQSACMTPIPPAQVDGGTATYDQARAAVQDAKNFIAQSDLYQECVGKEIDDATAKAKADGKKPDADFMAKEAALVNDNQKMKVKVGTEANEVFPAYHKAHP
ncbi:MAG TPA: hypothetical protein VHV26_13625 [Rhizomicrobium sp.]|jgi:hypothetical protein|nr:hypothetical protein [Rhizomicrobium sp.]